MFSLPCVLTTMITQSGQVRTDFVVFCKDRIESIEACLVQMEMDERSRRGRQDRFLGRPMAKFGRAGATQEVLLANHELEKEGCAVE